MNRYAKIILSRLISFSLLANFASFSQVSCMEKKPKKKKKNKKKNIEAPKSKKQYENSYFCIDNVEYDKDKSVEENVSVIFDKISNSMKRCLSGRGDDRTVAVDQYTKINEVNKYIFSELTKKNENNLGCIIDKFYKLDISKEIFGSVEISCIIYKALNILKDKIAADGNSNGSLDVRYVHIRNGVTLRGIYIMGLSEIGQLYYPDKKLDAYKLDETYASEDIDVVLYRIDNGTWMVADGLKQSALIQLARQYVNTCTKGQDENGKDLEYKGYDECFSELIPYFSGETKCELHNKFGFLSVPAQQYFDHLAISDLSYVFDHESDSHELVYPFGYNDRQAQIAANFLSGRERENSTATSMHEICESVNSNYDHPIITAGSEFIQAWKAFDDKKFWGSAHPVRLRVFNEDYNVSSGNNKHKTIKIYRNVPANTYSPLEKSSLYYKKKGMCGPNRSRSADLRKHR